MHSKAFRIVAIALGSLATIAIGVTRPGGVDWYPTILIALAGAVSICYIVAWQHPPSAPVVNTRRWRWVSVLLLLLLLLLPLSLFLRIDPAKTPRPMLAMLLMGTLTVGLSGLVVRVMTKKA